MTDTASATKKRSGGGPVAIILLVVSGLGFGGFYFWATSAASVDYGQAQQLIEIMESEHLLSAKHCASTVTARFKSRTWSQLNADRQRNVMLAISRVCSVRGQSNPVTLLDDRTGDILADFDGRNIVRR